MPRLIFKCPYIKGGTSSATAHLENYVKSTSVRQTTKRQFKTKADTSLAPTDVGRNAPNQISDVALSIEYVKQYTDSHSGISKNHAYLLRQLVVWQRLSVHLGWQCDNVRASYDEIPKATQDEVFSGARTFVKENKGRYECGGYIYSGEGQELGQFWAKLNVGKDRKSVV